MRGGNIPAFSLRNKPAPGAQASTFGQNTMEAAQYPCASRRPPQSCTGGQSWAPGRSKCTRSVAPATLSPPVIWEAEPAHDRAQPGPCLSGDPGVTPEPLGALQATPSLPRQSSNAPASTGPSTACKQPNSFALLPLFCIFFFTLSFKNILHYFKLYA